jgi:hypothetical protein
MNERTFSPGKLAVGLTFIALGTLFLLDRLEVLRIESGYIWPVVLIGIGLAVLVGGWQSRRNNG